MILECSVLCHNKLLEHTQTSCQNWNRRLSRVSSSVSLFCDHLLLRKGGFCAKTSTHVGTHEFICPRFWCSPSLEVLAKKKKRLNGAHGCLGVECRRRLQTQHQAFTCTDHGKKSLRTRTASCMPHTVTLNCEGLASNPKIDIVLSGTPVNCKMRRQGVAVPARARQHSVATTRYKAKHTP